MSNNRKRISNPTVIANNIAISIVPNSLDYVDGLGETTVEAQSAGGNSITAVYGDDATTKIGELKFEMFNTATNIALIKEWKLNSSANAFHVFDNTSDFSRVFQNAVLTTNVEVGLGSDKTISLEFKSDPAV